MEDLNRTADAPDGGGGDDDAKDDSVSDEEMPVLASAEIPIPDTVSLEGDDSDSLDDETDSDAGSSSNSSTKEVTEDSERFAAVPSDLSHPKNRRETSAVESEPVSQKIKKEEKEKKKKEKKKKKKKDPRKPNVQATRPPPRRSASSHDYFAKAAVLLIAAVLYWYFFSDVAPESASPFLDDTLVPFESFRVTGYGTSWIESDAKRLFQQYARMRSLCWHVSSELGFPVTLQKRAAGTDPDAVRLLNGRPESPFFCVNALLDQFAAGEIYTVHEQQQHRHRAIERMRAVLPTDNIELARQMIDFVSARRDINDRGPPDVMRPFKSIEEATNEQLGYLDDAVIVRNLAALEGNIAQLQLLDYGTLQEFALALHRAPASYQDSACVCGLYYGLPRNVVVTRSRNRTLLLLEPEIIRVAGGGQLMKSGELPWHRRPVPLRDNLASVSKAMFVAAGINPENPHLYHNELDVVSVALVEESKSSSSSSSSDGAAAAIHASSIRKLLHLSGPSAMCVEHCAFLATAWSDAADDYHLSPSDRLV
ncbi:MAG: hypothetical protein LC650_04150, partial [Actinobacteria bacterium]|nr:hypothetical protein [Actinomycetota bacterium]